MTESQKFSTALKKGGRACSAEDLVRTAQRFRAEVILRWDGQQKANAKSLLEILEAGAQRPREFTILTHGSDAVEAMQAMMKLCSAGILEFVGPPDSETVESGMLGQQSQR